MKKLLTALFAAGFVASSAHAVTLAEGTMETRISGYMDPTTANGVLIDADFSWGYFFADNAQAGGRVAFTDDDNVTVYGAAAFCEYNFEIDSEDWLPFVEGSLGLASADLDGGKSKTALFAEVQAGMKYFIAPNVAVSGAVVLDYATKEIYAKDDKFEDTDITVQFALRYYY